MMHAKKTIADSFKGNEYKYKEVFEIIEKRWECQMKHPLHLAGYFLNPQYFYANPDMAFDNQITNGLWTCIDRLVSDIKIQDKIQDELAYYKKAEGQFGLPIAIRSRATKSAGIYYIL